MYLLKRNDQIKTFSVSLTWHPYQKKKSVDDKTTDMFWERVMNENTDGWEIKENVCVEMPLSSLTATESAGSPEKFRSYQ